MPRYLLDTNILSDVIRRPDGIVSRHIERAGEAAICTSVVVAGELRYGAAKSDSPRIKEVDEAYGALRADLERTGSVIGANDLWIAAHALALDCTIVTANEREFGRVDGLALENWLLEA